MPEPPKKVGIIANLDKPEAGEVGGAALRELHALGIETQVEAELAARLEVAGVPKAQILADCDMLVVLGGDGTLISVAREDCQHPIPILGVKLGNFGFLASAMVKELSESLQQLARGEYSVSRRNALSCDVEDAGGNPLAHHAVVNDVYLSRSLPGRLMALELSVNRTSPIHYRADGVIVATPSGSTGHSLSAGGPIVAPDVEAVIVTPLCPHTLAGRPLLIRSEDEFSLNVIEPDDESVLVIMDGQITIDLPPGGKVRIRGDRYHFLLVKSPHRTYFDVLRSRFFIGGIDSR